MCKPHRMMVPVSLGLGRLQKSPIVESHERRAPGEGRNAVWLATQGFDVRSVDSSSAGVAKTSELAESRGVSVHATIGDVVEGSLHTGQASVVQVIARAV